MNKTFFIFIILFCAIILSSFIIYRILFYKNDSVGTEEFIIPKSSLYQLEKETPKGKLSNNQSKDHFIQDKNILDNLFSTSKKDSLLNVRDSLLQELELVRLQHQNDSIAALIAKYKK